LPGCDGSDEDVLTYAMFPQVGAKFFETRAAGPRNLGHEPDVSDAGKPSVPPVDRRRGPVWGWGVGALCHPLLLAVPALFFPGVAISGRLCPGGAFHASRGRA
ncbi:MAG TPA: hypothetical protein PKD69_09690, partial [Elusimicrobiota bacterium]|nr:hypothetical protein [Elusimicrobiota bacterium]